MTAGRAPPLVLLHGAGGTGAFWAPIRARLGDLPTLAPDLPGRRAQPGPPRATTAEMAAFLAETVLLPDLGPVVLVGHSMGSAVAMELALASPPLARGQIHGVILISAGARLRVLPAILAAQEEAASAAPPGALDEGGCPPATTLADWRAVDRFDHLHDAAAISVPTRILVGSEDVLTPPKYAAWLAARVPGAVVEVVEGAGHMLPVEHPDRVAAALRAAVTAWT